MEVTALHGNDVAAQVLLERGASTRAADVNGDTPLHVAASRGSGTVAALIVAQDALAVRVANKFGRTPVHVAAAAQLNSQTVIHPSHYNRYPVSTVKQVLRALLDASDASGKLVQLGHRDKDGNTCAPAAAKLR